MLNAAMIVFFPVYAFRSTWRSTGCSGCRCRRKGGSLRIASPSPLGEGWGEGKRLAETAVLARAPAPARRQSVHHERRHPFTLPRGEGAEESAAVQSYGASGAGSSRISPSNRPAGSPNDLQRHARGKVSVPAIAPSFIARATACSISRFAS